MPFGGKVNGGSMPRHLSAESRRQMAKIVVQYDVEDQAVLQLLATAYEQHDQMLAARAEIKKTGRSQTDRYGGTKASPFVAQERAASKAFSVALERAVRMAERAQQKTELKERKVAPQKPKTFAAHQRDEQSDAVARMANWFATPRHRFAVPPPPPVFVWCNQINPETGAPNWSDGDEDPQQRPDFVARFGPNGYRGVARQMAEQKED